MARRSANTSAQNQPHCLQILKATFVAFKKWSLGSPLGAALMRQEKLGAERLEAPPDR